MSRTAQYLLAVLFCAAITPTLQSSASPALSNNHDVAFDSDRSPDDPEEKWEHDPIVFIARDRETIRNYYRPLTTRDGNLPQSLRKHLHRNAVLPIGLQKRLQPLAADVERKLQPLYSGYLRGLIGQDAVIIDKRTQRIMDIIHDVTARR